jgi:hypothetical protein
MKPMHPFERALLVMRDELELQLEHCGPVPWSDFLLNPRKLRGSDFLMRWSQGVWSEQQLVRAVDATGEFFAVPYGPSGVAPTDDVRAYELYFERLEHAGLGNIKRPDLLIFPAVRREVVGATLAELGGPAELPFTREDDTRMARLISLSVLAVECENSLWKAQQMPAYNAPLRPQKRLGQKSGLAKSAVLPTVIVKDEDLARLVGWETAHHRPIHIWHAFYDLAFGLSLVRARELLAEGLIEGTKQIFQAPGGASATKVIYKFYHQYAYPLATSTGEPQLVAQSITDKNGHILPFVRFEGGGRALTPEALGVLRTAMSVLP